MYTYISAKRYKLGLCKTGKQCNAYRSLMHDRPFKTRSEYYVSTFVKGPLSSDPRSDSDFVVGNKKYI